MFNVCDAAIECIEMTNRKHIFELALSVIDIELLFVLPQKSYKIQDDARKNEQMKCEKTKCKMKNDNLNVLIAAVVVSVPIVVHCIHHFRMDKIK